MGLKNYSVSRYVILPHTRADGAVPLEESPIYASLRNAVVHQVINEVFWRKDVTSFPVEYVSTPIREKEKLWGGDCWTSPSVR